MKERETQDRRREVKERETGCFTSHYQGCLYILRLLHLGDEKASIFSPCLLPVQNIHSSQDVHGSQIESDARYKRNHRRSIPDKILLKRYASFKCDIALKLLYVSRNTNNVTSCRALPCPALLCPSILQNGVERMYGR